MKHTQHKFRHDIRSIFVLTSRYILYDLRLYHARSALSTNFSFHFEIKTNKNQVGKGQCKKWVKNKNLAEKMTNKKRNDKSTLHQMHTHRNRYFRKYAQIIDTWNAHGRHSDTHRHTHNTQHTEIARLICRFPHHIHTSFTRKT